MDHSKSTAPRHQATRRPLATIFRLMIGLGVTTIIPLAAGGQDEAHLWADALVKTTDLLPKDDIHGERVFGFASAMTKHGCHVVKVEGTASAQWVRLDGVAGRRYNAIAGLPFSANGKTLAYVAAAESNQSVVVDGRAGPPFPEIEPQTLVLSLDGQPGSPYDQIGHFEFSPDSRRVVYHAVNGGTSVVVVDGVERARYQGVPAGPAIRQDGALELIAAQDGLQRIVVKKW